MEIWINPACSKCRTAQRALEEAGVEHTVRRYLDDPPTAKELGAVVDRLGLEPWDVARPRETREAGIDLPRTPQARAEWLAALAANPRAIQRPIVTADDGTTLVARDGETLARAVALGRPGSAPVS
ncbi:arsenate reductase [Nocardioides sp. dk4132]|uniref:ArsC/Spx/MgsR family protein n=1 Tax=unclassified Nocardioides TaxID=2615069 RepID=UPI0012960B45|nr:MULTISPECIES: ArsC/Spx/MgsR family protein [unclassified Nocardioides]MQW76483.1 arsenate reductase [Nocardioides sp. dk4132]QGA09619.1 arsenate reductase [Nocardioides sp. dk884]